MLRGSPDFPLGSTFPSFAVPTTWPLHLPRSAIVFGCWRWVTFTSRWAFLILQPPPSSPSPKLIYITFFIRVSTARFFPSKSHCATFASNSSHYFTYHPSFGPLHMKPLTFWLTSPSNMSQTAKKTAEKLGESSQSAPNSTAAQQSDNVAHALAGAGGGLLSMALT